eukprot:3676123-Rhodomonas_salina.3
MRMGVYGRVWTGTFGARRVVRCNYENGGVVLLVRVLKWRNGTADAKMAVWYYQMGQSTCQRFKSWARSVHPPPKKKNKKKKGQIKYRPKSITRNHSLATIRTTRAAFFI